MKFREIDIEELESDKEAFTAWGWVTLKVQRGEEIIGVKVKITSVPQETIDDLRKRQPKPPSRTLMLDPSMPEAQALGVTTRQKATIPDYNDQVYLDTLDAYNMTFRREVVGRGVASQLKLQDGSLASTPEQRYKALEEKGISGIHFAEIAQQILNLTTWTEDERTNFLTPVLGPTTPR